MTPEQKNIVRSLIAFAWVDGKFADQETDIVEGMLKGFGASTDEQTEFTEYAKTRRTLHDIPVGELKGEHRELLLGNAALLTLSDGDQANVERVLLKKLGQLLGFSAEDGDRIIDAALDGALHLPKESLVPENQPPRRK
jgi:tellurite resistance protein